MIGVSFETLPTKALRYGPIGLGDRGREKHGPVGGLRRQNDSVTWLECVPLV